MKDTFEKIEGFEWDSGNETKNWLKHRVGKEECEQVFFQQPLVVSADQTHSQNEDRYRVLGRTENGRELFLVFTFRSGNIRIILARDMSRKEQQIYEKIEKNSTVRK